MFDQKYKKTIGLLIRTVDIFMTRIKNFQMVYEILSISGQVRALFNRMWDIDQVIPIANVYHNPILDEGNADGVVSNNSIEAWRNIFRIRKTFFENEFSRIVLEF